jgi:dTMP kinase
MAGLFITLEGGEGTGKSTQMELLASFLEKKGYEVLKTREPGGTEEAEKIRELLVSRDGGNWTPTAECLLFFAARNMHAENLIKPAIEEGKIVISDRFADSTRAYQSYGHELDPDIIEKINDVALGGFEPDITFIMNLPTEKGLARAGKRLEEDQSGEDRFEQLDIKFHERLRQGFLDIAEKNPDRCIIIDADRPIEEISKSLQSSVCEYLDAHNKEQLEKAENV